MICHCCLTRYTVCRDQAGRERTGLGVQYCFASLQHPDTRTPSVLTTHTGAVSHLWKRVRVCVHVYLCVRVCVCLLPPRASHITMKAENVTGKIPMRKLKRNHIMIGEEYVGDFSPTELWEVWMHPCFNAVSVNLSFFQQQKGLWIGLTKPTFDFENQLRRAASLMHYAFFFKSLCMRCTKYANKQTNKQTCLAHLYKISALDPWGLPFEKCSFKGGFIVCIWWLF